MPDQPDTPQNPAGRGRPRLSDLPKETTEEELWDLEDDEQAAAATPAPSKSKSDTPPAMAEEPVADDDAEAATLEPSEPVAEPEPAARKEPEPEPTPKKAEPATPADGGATRKSERIGLIALAVVILGLLIWGIASLSSSISTTRLGDDLPDFPVEGGYAVVKEIESYWRPPNREGARPDVARTDIAFIPVVSITLREGGTGVLRAIFRNEEGDFIGDSISLGFVNGAFDANASPTIEFPATSGFETASEFNGYRVGEERWTVEVFEGPSADAPGSEFNQLFTAPISTNRQ